MRPRYLIFGLILLTACGSKQCSRSAKSDTTLVVRAGEVKKHLPTGLTIGVETKNTAEDFAKLYKQAFSQKDIDPEEIGKAVGEYETRIHFRRRDGAKEVIEISENGLQPFDFTQDGKTYRVTLVGYDPKDVKGKRVELTFRVNEVKEAAPPSPVSLPMEPTYASDSVGTAPTSADSPAIVETSGADEETPSSPVEKYVEEEDHFSESETFNDEVTGLYIYCKKIDQVNQIVQFDVKYPTEAQKRKDLVFKSSMPQCFSAQGKSYRLTVTEISLLNCSVRIEEL